MNLSGKPKEFTLSDIEETNGEPVKAKITQLSPEEVDKTIRSAGFINMRELAKFYFLAEQQGVKIEDLAKDSAMSEEEKGKIMITLIGSAEAAGVELPTALLGNKRSAVETYNLLQEHVVGWSGVFGDDGKQVPFTADTQKIFLAALPAIVKDKIVDAIEHLTQHGVLPGEDSSSPI